MKILLVSVGFYPDKDAGSTRITFFAKMLKNIGHNPVVVGYNKFDNYKVETIDSVDYISLKPRMRNFKQSIKEILEKGIINPDIIWIYWAPLTSFIYLKKYAKINNKMLIHDSVEFFSSKSIKQRLSYSFIENNFINKYVLDRNFRIISISSYLQEYYGRKNIKTIRIPVLMDVKKMNSTKKYINDDKIHLLYAGSPSHSKNSSKDDLKTILESLRCLPSDISCKFKVTIIGINNDQVKNYYDIELNNENLDIEALGRISRNEVIEALSHAHFTILLRDAKSRNSKAGFPTKVVESLSTGTPIICNLSSDLGMYLENDKNSIIVEDNTIESFKKGLEKAATLNQYEIEKMSINALESAENYFDFRLYEKQLKEFLNG